MAEVAEEGYVTLVGEDGWGEGLLGVVGGGEFAEVEGSDGGVSEYLIYGVSGMKGLTLYNRPPILVSASYLSSQIGGSSSPSGFLDQESQCASRTSLCCSLGSCRPASPPTGR